MTLKTRNRLLKFFLLASLCVVALSLATFIISVLSHRIIEPPAFRIPAFLDKQPLTKNSFTALMLSFLILLLYVPFCFYFLLKFFENTQTTEIIFFTGFLLACLAECARFITICLGLWLSFTNILIIAGDIVLFGRTLAPLSFLCAAILSDTDQRQDIERNYIILIMASLVFAVAIPMTTARITSTGLVTEGFMILINIMRFFLLLTAVVSFFINGVRKNSMEHKSLAYSAGGLLLSYSILVSTDSFLFLVLGTSGLIAGTYIYLTTLHKMYMWS